MAEPSSWKVSSNHSLRACSGLIICSKLWSLAFKVIMRPYRDSLLFHKNSAFCNIKIATILKSNPEIPLAMVVNNILVSNRLGKLKPILFKKPP